MSAPSQPLDSYHWYRGELEHQAIFWLSICLCFFFGLAAVTLLIIPAPYGRYNHDGEKATQGLLIRLVARCDVPAKVAWILQESPNLLAALLCFSTGSAECLHSLGNALLLLCFVAHYINRTIIYPLRMKGSKPTPLPIMLMATAFCSANGYLQCRTLTRLIVVPASSVTLPIGIVLWAVGLYINHDADHILRNLRRPGETGYKIPRGGMFDYVSGANFFGEIVEWTGYAIAMGGALPAVTFAFCTACNVGPRALSHHRWYLDKFKDEYPKSRRALVPFLL